MKNKKDILKLVNNKNLYIRFITFLVACFLIALNYNLILSPHNFVTGGMSGLAIVISRLTPMSKTMFLNLSTVVLFFVSLALLDKKLTFKSLFGSMCFNVMVMLTEPITKTIDLNINSTFILLILTAAVIGVCYGTIFRVGFTTGGSDIITAIISKYGKIPMGRASTLTNIFIIGSGLIVFGLTKTIYAVFILLFGNYILDIVLLGIKDSKMCYIKSSKSDEIRDYLIKELKLGVTEIASKGGIFKKVKPVLLVVVSFEQYYHLKYIIQKIDPKAFVLTKDCFGVAGGYKKRLLPF